MIVDAVIKIVVTLLTGCLGLVPSFTLDSAALDLGKNLGGSLSTVNGVIPVTDIGEVLVLIVGVRGLMFVWSLIVFVYDRFPFKAT